MKIAYYLCQLFSEYVVAWMRGKGMDTPNEKDFNKAVSEQTAYARKKIKKSL